MNRFSALVSAVALAALHFSTTATTDVPHSLLADPNLGWQSYCATPNGGPARKSGDPTITSIRRLPMVTDNFRTGYGYAGRHGMTAWNLATHEKYSWEAEEWKPVRDTSCPPFMTATHTFGYSDTAVTACEIASPRCISIAIHPKTWPYVFASADNAVLAVTNYGGALLFKDGEWCRMQREGDDYACDGKLIDPIAEPRGLQFYSSVVYDGRTLVGEWPSGRLYDFDGTRLVPTTKIPQPPFVGDPKGYEAQSMAVYCGVLYVGYWPHGEVWRYHSQEWELAYKLFTPPPQSEDFIPYVKETEAELPFAFYGQRVTSLVEQDRKLYAFTSNLRSWPRDYHSSILSEEQQQEYGAIYEIEDHKCSSAG